MATAATARHDTVHKVRVTRRADEPRVALATVPVDVLLRCHAWEWRRGYMYMYVLYGRSPWYRSQAVLEVREQWVHLQEREQQ